MRIFKKTISVFILTGLILSLCFNPVSSKADERTTSVGLRVWAYVASNNDPKPDGVLKYRIDGTDEWKTVESDWNYTSVSVEQGTKVWIKLEKDDKLAIGSVMLDLEEYEEQIGYSSAGHVYGTLQYDEKTSVIAEGLLSEEGFCLDTSGYRTMDLDLSLVEMPDEITLRFKNVVGIEDGALQIQSGDGKIVDLSVEYCDHGCPRHYGGTTLTRLEGYSYQDGYTDAILNLKAMDDPDSENSMYVLKLKSYELYNNYRFRFGSKFRYEKYFYDPKYISQIYAVSSTDDTIEHGILLDSWSYADLRIPIGYYSDWWGIICWEGYEDPYTQKFAYRYDGSDTVDIYVRNNSSYESLDGIEINFSKSENYENYLTGQTGSFAEYKVNGVMVKIAPVSTATMLAQSYSYDLGGGKWEPNLPTTISYLAYNDAYIPIRNYRWITDYVDQPTTDFVLDNKFDPETMSVWLRRVDSKTSETVSGSALKLKVSDTPYKVTISDSLDIENPTVEFEGYYLPYDDAQGYISLVDSGIDKSWLGKEYYLTIEPNSAETPEITPEVTPVVTPEVTPTTTPTVPDNGGSSGGYTPYVPYTPSTTTPAPTATPIPIATPVPTATPTPAPVVEEQQNEDGSVTSIITTKNTDGTTNTEETTRHTDGSLETITTVTDKKGNGTITGSTVNKKGRTTSTTTGTISKDSKGTVTEQTKTEYTNGTVAEKTVKTTKAGKVVTEEATTDAKGLVTVNRTAILPDGSEVAKKFTSLDDGTLKLTKVTADYNYAVIPATLTVNGKEVPVTTIAKNAFKGNKTLTKVKIGKNIVTIGKNAFANMPNLKKITILSENLNKVGKNAFSDLSNGATIKIKASKQKYNEIKAMITKSGIPEGLKFKRVK